MPKFSDTQLVILSGAAQRDNGAILPPPKRLKVKAGALTNVLRSLLRKGLIEEHPAPPDAPAWRENEDGQRFLLTVSAAGLEAIGLVPEADATAPSSASATKRKSRSKSRRGKPTNGKKRAASSSTRRTSKQDAIADLLRRPEGATIAELQTAIGWQPHSVRAALTGLRKKGHYIIRSKADGDVTRYRVASGPKGVQP